MAVRLRAAAGVGLRRSRPGGDFVRAICFSLVSRRALSFEDDAGSGRMKAPDRAAVVRGLREMLGEGALVTEPHELARYEKGWRYGSGTALAVVRPGSTEDVARVLAFASAQGIRLVPQGANTGLVGASTPDASGDMLVLSL